MRIKSIPAPKSGPTPFGPLPTVSPSSQNLQKEAKKLNNLEKGKAADEKYLGEEQNVEARVRKMLEPQSVFFPGQEVPGHPSWCECGICYGMD